MRIALVLTAILATPPAVVANASAGEKARIDEILRHILPVSPRRVGLRNDAAEQFTAALKMDPGYKLAEQGLAAAGGRAR